MNLTISGEVADQQHAERLAVAAQARLARAAHAAQVEAAHEQAAHVDQAEVAQAEVPRVGVARGVSAEAPTGTPGARTSATSLVQQSTSALRRLALPWVAFQHWVGAGEL